MDAWREARDRRQMPPPPRPNAQDDDSEYDSPSSSTMRSESQVPSDAAHVREVKRDDVILKKTTPAFALARQHLHPQQAPQARALRPTAIPQPTREPSRPSQLATGSDEQDDDILVDFSRSPPRQPHSQWDRTYGRTAQSSRFSRCNSAISKVPEPCWWIAGPSRARILSAQWRATSPCASLRAGGVRPVWCLQRLHGAPGAEGNRHPTPTGSTTVSLGRPTVTVGPTSLFCWTAIACSALSTPFLPQLSSG